MDCVQLELDFESVTPEPVACASPLLPSPRSPEGLVIDRNRATLLDALYLQDGRDQEDHPQHGFYTGLAEALHLRLGRALVDKLLESDGFEAILITGSDG